jgi:hypothetical protein
VSGQLTHASPHTPLAHRPALLTQYRGVHARTWVQLEAENMHHASRGCTTNPRTASVTRQAWSALVALEQKAAVPLLVEDRYNFSCVVSASKPLHVRRLHPIGAIELHKGSRRLRKGPRYIEQQFEPPLNRSVGHPKEVDVRDRETKRIGLRYCVDGIAHNLQPPHSHRSAVGCLVLEDTDAASVWLQTRRDVPVARSQLTKATPGDMAR